MEFEPPIADIALAFARALVAGEYQIAHGMLTNALKLEMSADELKRDYRQMISYTTAPPDTIKMGQFFEPPADVAAGLGWAFVDIDPLHSPTDTWLEQVGVLVVEEGSRQAIAQIEWGRP